MSKSLSIYINTVNKSVLFRNLLAFIHMSGRAHHLSKSLRGGAGVPDNVGCIAIPGSGRGLCSLDGSGIAYWEKPAAGAEEVTLYDFLTALEAISRKREERIVDLVDGCTAKVTREGVKFDHYGIAISAREVAELAKIVEGRNS